MLLQSRTAFSILQLTPNKLYLWILLGPEPQQHCSAGPLWHGQSVPALEGGLV